MARKKGGTARMSHDLKPQETVAVEEEKPRVLLVMTLPTTTVHHPFLKDGRVKLKKGQRITDPRVAAIIRERALSSAFKLPEK